MRRLFAMLPLLLVFAACAPPLTVEEARATAVVSGCWPYGVHQPDTPVPASTVRPLTPTATPAPTALAYPACTPQPGHPTATVRPTRTPRPIPPPTPPSAPPLSGIHEIGQPPGKNTNLRLAIQADGRAAVAWTNWGWAPPENGPDGQVFVRVQGRSGSWGIAQTLTRQPVGGGVGGVGIAATISDTLIVAWGDGVGAIWTTETRDNGESWSQPFLAGTFAYQVIALHSDAIGGLHLLALTPDPHQLRYAYRAPTATSWAASAIPFAGEHFGGELAVLNLPGGGVRRFVVARLDGGVGLVRSDGGRTWTPIPVELGRFMSEPNPDKVSVMAASRPAGNVVAVSWSQYSKGGVFTQLSIDGGMTWGREERIAQHQDDGSCYAGDSGDSAGLPCGYWPSMAYDAATDSLAFSWVEVVRKREPPMRTVLAARLLSKPDSDGWRFAVTPDQGDNEPPLLAPWGWQGTLYGSPEGHYAWLVLIDTRNDQNRVEARQIELPALLGEVES